MCKTKQRQNKKLFISLFCLKPLGSSSESTPPSWLVGGLAFRESLSFRWQMSWRLCSITTSRKPLLSSTPTCSGYHWECTLPPAHTIPPVLRTWLHQGHDWGQGPLGRLWPLVSPGTPRYSFPLVVWTSPNGTFREDSLNLCCLGHTHTYTNTSVCRNPFFNPK